MHLRHFSGVQRFTTNSELLIEYTEFFESLRKLKSDNVLVDLGSQLDLDFKSHRHVRASASEILRLHEVAYPVCTSGDPL